MTMLENIHNHREVSCYGFMTAGLAKLRHSPPYGSLADTTRPDPTRMNLHRVMIGLDCLIVTEPLSMDFDRDAK